MDSCPRSVATRFEKVISISCSIVACYATGFRSKKSFRIEDGGFVAPSGLIIDRRGKRNAHFVGCSFQCFVTAWDQLAASVGALSTERPLQPFINLPRPWADFQVFNDEGEKASVGCHVSPLYVFTASKTQNPEEFLASCKVQLPRSLPLHLLSPRAFCRNFARTYSFWSYALSQQG